MDGCEIRQKPIPLVVKATPVMELYCNNNRIIALIIYTNEL